jgi:putative PIN family toxin of toxin-antitoxin system
LKVVFDTSVLVSALVFPGGRGEQALQRVLEEQDRLFLSRAILDELLGVLARKFARDAEALSRTAVFLGDVATLVKPARRVQVLRDDPDNRVLECAVAAGADAIVTGDREMLALGEHAGVRILSLAEYLAAS